MNSADDDEAREELVGRCYTKARRHPLVIGKLPGGGRLWGGPYTVAQMLVAAVVFVLLLATQGLWGHFGLVNYVILFGVPYALALAVGRLSVEGRSPLSVAGSVLGLACAPRSGRMAGRPLRSRRRGRPLWGGGVVSVGGSHADGAFDAVLERELRPVREEAADAGAAASGSASFSRAQAVLRRSREGG